MRISAAAERRWSRGPALPGGPIPAPAVVDKAELSQSSGVRVTTLSG